MATAHEIIATAGRLTESGLTGAAFMEALVEAHPLVTIAEFERAIAVAEHDHAAKAAEEDAHVEALERILGHLEANGVSGEVQIGPALQALASAGDQVAAAMLAALDNPEGRAHWALAVAAANAHPDWAADEDCSSIRRLDGQATEDGSDVDALIEWFQKNHPLKAREIEARS